MNASSLKFLNGSNSLIYQETYIDHKTYGYRILITVLPRQCALLPAGVFFFDHCKEEHNPIHVN